MGYEYIYTLEYSIYTKYLHSQLARDFDSHLKIKMFGGYLSFFLTEEKRRSKSCVPLACCVYVCMLVCIVSIELIHT